MGDGLSIDAEAVEALASDSGALQATMNKMMTEIWERQRRDSLLCAKPEKLAGPVYETISREMIHDTYRPIPLKQFLADLTKLTKKAPEGCPVFVSYDKESDYEGGYYYYFEVGFERPPTAEEIDDRKALNAEIREVQAEARAAAAKRERAEFERLKAKFESDSDGSGEAGET